MNMKGLMTAIFTVVMLCLNISAQTTAFTYQGSLQSSGSPANGNYDFEFALFDALTNGGQLGSTIAVNNVAVTSGVFVVKLDFGNQFPGADRYLEIRVRLAGQPGITTLGPRQLFNSAPYAVKSISAETSVSAVNAGQLGGVAAAEYVVTGDTRLSDARDPLPNSPNYIQNTKTAQAISNFNVSGTGTADIFNAATQYNLSGSRILSNGGTNNMFAGAGAGTANISGSGNSFFGSNAGMNNTASGNSFFGSNAGQSNSIGFNNSFFGTSAGSGNVGGGNTFVGHLAGGSNVAGSSNTAVGDQADMLSTNLTNATAIGANAKAAASNTIILGSIAGVGGATNDTSVGIGVSVPNSAYRLHVRSLFTAIAGETTGTAQVGVYGGGRTGVWGSSPGAAGTGVLATSFNSGGVAFKATGTSWFSGDTTPLSTSVVGTGTGVALGSSPGIGYIFAIDYSTFASKVLALNSPGGNVGIGTLAPDQTLSVNGNASKVGGGSWLTFSDERLKDIEGRFTPGLAAVMQLQPILYRYKIENALGIRSDGEHVGFSAQAVEQIIPEAVTKNDQGYRLVNNDPIMWAMLNAVKEQQAQIKEQKAEIELLKATICELKPSLAICK